MFALVARFHQLSYDLGLQGATGKRLQPLRHLLCRGASRVYARLLRPIR